MMTWDLSWWLLVSASSLKHNPAEDLADADWPGDDC